MTTIKQLSSVDYASTNDQLPIYRPDRGDTRKLTVGQIFDYVVAQGGGGGGNATWGTITGTLSAQTDLQTALDGKQPAGSYQPLSTVLTNTTASFTTAQETKLAGIATGATANQTDAYLLDRANHTGTQSVSTITGLATVATSGSAADLTGNLSVSRLNGGTGASGTTFWRGDGTWATPAGGVTSVSGTGTVSGLTLTGTVTTTGSLTLGGTLSVVPANFASQTANTFLAAPNGASGVPTFRTIVAADVPTLNQNTTGSAATLTTSRNFSISGGGITAAAVGFNGSAAVALSASVDAGHITLARMANLAANSFIGNNTGVSATPLALTGTQATALLDTFTSVAKGLAPASGGGTTNFLRADGTWAAPAGGGSVTTVSVVTANGVSGSVANPTTTPAITLTLGAITPSSVASVGTVTGSNLSGTNTGDQTITLTGDVTGTGTGSFAATIANDAVTFAKMQNASAASVLLGRGAGAGAGDFQEITLGTNLSMSGTTLNATGGGGGGSPGGSTTQIQFNDAGAFGGDADLTWDKTTNDLTLGGTDTGITMAGITNEPSSPASGNLHYYSKSIAGRMMPKIKGPSGLDTVMQTALFPNRILMYVPSTGTTGTGSGTGLGPVWTSGGTVSHPTPSSTAPAISNQMRRTRYANVVTTTNQTLGIKAAAADTLNYWRGSAAGLGGFFFAARFIVELYPASTVRLFAGLTASSATYVVASDTVLNNTCGLWHDTTDPSSGAGAFNFVTRDTTTTTKQSINLANAIAAGNSYDFYMWCAPNGGTIFWRLDDVVNNVTYENSTSTTLPANTAFMGPQCAMSNGTANITVTTSAIGIAGVYTESDR